MKSEKFKYLKKKKPQLKNEKNKKVNLGAGEERRSLKDTDSF